MAMRMPPQVANQPVIPDVNRTSLVLFAGLALIVLNLFWQNGTAMFSAIFQKGANVQFTAITDTGLQLLGLAGLTILAQYGGENAGTAALMFIGALWLLWLLAHFGTHPASEPVSATHTEANPQPNQSAGSQGGQGGQKL